MRKKYSPVFVRIDIYNLLFLSVGDAGIWLVTYGQDLRTAQTLWRLHLTVNLYKIEPRRRASDWNSTLSVEVIKYDFNLIRILIRNILFKRLLLWARICDATGCFVKALPMGQNILLDKSYTKQLGQISILKHCKQRNCLARFSEFKVNKKQKQ